MQESQEPESISRNFLKVLADPDDAQLDVVAVHGLNYRDVENHAEETWTAPNGKMWLRDFLPTQLPNARILLFGYNANLAFTSSTAGVDEQAQNLLNRLRLKRKGVPEDRPVMFICYSLGGIIVKRALVDAKLDKTYESIRKLCHGIVFFGTPHQGGNLAGLGQIAGIPLKNTFIEAFIKDSLYADNISNDFRHQLEDRFVLTFFETQAVKDFGVIVDKKSATLGLPGQRETRLALDTDHENICKFYDCSAPDYEQVADNIQELAEKVIKEALEADPRENKNYEERIRILTWLSDIAVKDHHTFISSNRLAGTGKWLLKKPEFVGWKESTSSSILWLHGIAGAGKSKLASRVIDEFRRTRKRGEALAYFYCNYKEENRRDPGYILRAIVKQLFVMESETKLLEPLINLYRKREREGFLSKLLQPEEARAFISELAGGYKQTIICIDALDECHKDTRKNLLSVLNQILKSSTKPVKVFVTSRDDHDIKLRLEDSPNVYIQASDNMNDINRFVETEIERRIAEKDILDGNIDPDLKLHIIKTLINGANGMFLWADMQIRGICRERSAGDINKALEQLPKDLDGTFSEILERIEKQPNDDPTLAKRALKFVLCAQRPLSFNELIGAISITPGETERQDDSDRTEKDILDVCQNLVVVDKERGVLRFAHLSVQDFLRQRFESSHTYVAETCLTLLCWPNYEYGYCERKESAFTQYSSLNWGIHVQFSETSGGSTLLVELQKNFLTLSLGFKTWCRMAKWYIIRPNRELPPFLESWEPGFKPDSSSLLFVACHYGLLEALQSLLGTRKRAVPSLLKNSSILLKLKSTQDSNGRTLFHYAASQGHERIIKELLRVVYKSLGQRVPAKNQLVDWLTKKALYWVNHKSNDGLTPLHQAAEGGHEGIVKLLLQAGADASCKVNDNQTLLHLAAEGGHEGIVKLLLQAGADASCKGNDNQTPLHWAAEGGHEGIVKLLLQVGADANCKDNHSQTPLHQAAKGGHEGVVKLLLQAGADASCKDNNSQTPLYRAAGSGHEGVVKLLLQAGADASCKDNNCWTPLYWAVWGGHEGVVKLLLQAGADASCKDNNSQTPLYRAASRGHEGVVKLLLQAGADASCKDNDSRTPLYQAAERGHEGVVKLLLQAGADASCKDNDSWTPLHQAASRGHEGVVKLLLQAGADASCKDNNSWTLLYRAAVYGHEGVVKLLLQAGADANYKANYNWTPLHEAAGRGYEGVVKLLLKAGADANYKANYNWTPLHEAAGRGYEGVVKLLLKAGADTNCKDNMGRTPLHLAAESIYVETVKLLLLTKGIDINCRDNNGITPLELAIRVKNGGSPPRNKSGWPFEVIKLLETAGATR